MKRIDSVNARPNVNGAGKTGFHDNNDISGQDATYLTPDWLNHIQEELCALLEKNGRTLNAGQRDQLYQLLATDDDVLALAAAVQQKLDTEKAQREAADSVLQGNINGEASIRADADIALQNGINNEAIARSSADDALWASMFGVNQLHQDVTSSRFSSTVYTNTSGRPKHIIISTSVESADNELFIGNISVSYGRSSSTAAFPIIGIVLDGQQYRYEGKFTKWVELG